ncbi:hypothetical protein [Lipingzhangella rawalii]|uniref:hypothetical protein n=1 Tax=Lipingzhangella rawalii TaxID=2055835 RepID=UPI00287B5E95|nr:hypothetical protein [Lipingzhangella rawalii]
MLRSWPHLDKRNVGGQWHPVFQFMAVVLGHHQDEALVMADELVEVGAVAVRRLSTGADVVV